MWSIVSSRRPMFSLSWSIISSGRPRILSLWSIIIINMADNSPRNWQWEQPIFFTVILNVTHINLNISSSGVELFSKFPCKDPLWGKTLKRDDVHNIFIKTKIIDPVLHAFRDVSCRAYFPVGTCNFRKKLSSMSSVKYHRPRIISLFVVMIKIMSSWPIGLNAHRSKVSGLGILFGNPLKSHTHYLTACVYHFLRGWLLNIGNLGLCWFLPATLGCYSLRSQ